MDAKPPLRQQIVQQLTRVGVSSDDAERLLDNFDASLLPQIALLSIGDHEPQQMWRLWAEMDPTLVDTLIALLRDQRDQDVREAAVMVLGYIRDPKAVEALIDVLQEEESPVEWWAAISLGETGDARAVEPLIDKLDRDDHGNRVEALAKLGTPAVQPLIAKLHDNNVRVRALATDTLGRIADPRAVGPLLSLLGDEDSLVRQSAVLALGDLGDQLAIEPLIAMLKDPEPDVRYSTCFALADLSARQAVGSLLDALKDEQDFVRWSAMKALVELGDSGSVEHLIIGLQDEDPNIRYWAVVGLGRFAERRVVPMLQRIQDNDSGVADAMHGALRGEYSIALNEAATAAIESINSRSAR